MRHLALNRLVSQTEIFLQRNRSKNANYFRLHSSFHFLSAFSALYVAHLLSLLFLPFVSIFVCMPEIPLSRNQRPFSFRFDFSNSTASFILMHACKANPKLLFPQSHLFAPMLFAKSPQSPGNPYNMDNCGFSINFRYRSDGGSNPFKGFVGTADDYVISLWIIFHEAEVGLAGAVFSEEFEDSIPNSVHDSPFIDGLLAYNFESQVTFSHQFRHCFSFLRLVCQELHSLDSAFPCSVQL